MCLLVRRVDGWGTSQTASQTVGNGEMENGELPAEIRVDDEWLRMWHLGSEQKKIEWLSLKKQKPHFKKTKSAKGSMFFSTFPVEVCFVMFNWFNCHLTCWFLLWLVFGFQPGVFRFSRYGDVTKDDLQVTKDHTCREDALGCCHDLE